MGFRAEKLQETGLQNVVFLFCKATRTTEPTQVKTIESCLGYVGQSPQSPFLPLPEKKPRSFNKSLLQEAKSESTQKRQQGSLAMNRIHTLAYPDPSSCLCASP